MVVATASLLGNWRAEFARFAPARQVRILHGASRDAEREKVQPGDVILTSYGTLARDLAYHLKRDYRAIVVDEASLMRNPDTDHAKALAKLRATCRIALTGTPIENGVQGPLVDLPLHPARLARRPRGVQGTLRTAARHRRIRRRGDRAAAFENLALPAPPDQGAGGSRVAVQALHRRVLRSQPGPAGGL